MGRVVANSGGSFVVHLFSPAKQYTSNVLEQQFIYFFDSKRTHSIQVPTVEKGDEIGTRLTTFTRKSLAGLAQQVDV
jgi:hypothetical protein